MTKQEAINLLPTNEEVDKDPVTAAAAWQEVPDEVKSELIKDGSVSVDHNKLAGQTVVWLSDEAETSKIVEKGKKKVVEKAPEPEVKAEDKSKAIKPKK
jgi:hypothetical protein